MQKALDNLAFDFAHDLRETFAQRGQTVEGRPLTLIVDTLYRRLLVKGFVTELARQRASQEHVITEDEAVAIIRGQADELSGGETPPYA